MGVTSFDCSNICPGCLDEDFSYFHIYFSCRIINYVSRDFLDELSFNIRNNWISSVMDRYNDPVFKEDLLFYILLGGFLGDCISFSSDWYVNNSLLSFHSSVAVLVAESLSSAMPKATRKLWALLNSYSLSNSSNSTSLEPRASTPIFWHDMTASQPAESDSEVSDVSDSSSTEEHTPALREYIGPLYPLLLTICKFFLELGRRANA